MAKEFTAEVEELIGPIKEGANSNWCKYIAKISYNGKPPNIDIRNIKFEEDGNHFFGKGISLTDEECDTMVDILLENGYGSIGQLEKSLNDRKNIFGNNNDDDCYDEDGSLSITLGDRNDGLYF